MTRNRKVDPEVLEREYIYDQSTPPISFTALAERHGLARNTVAEKGIKGRWFERRKEFRETLGMKVTEALADQWVRYETAVREKAMSAAVEYIDKYVEKLQAGEININTKDMLGMTSMLRTLMTDATAAKGTEEVLLDPDTADLDPEFARRILDATDAGRIGPGPEAPPPSPEGAGEAG